MINPYDPDGEDETIDPLEEVEMTSSCEINWLEPEPDRESTDYEQYTDQLSDVCKEITFYSAFYNPPTEDEYNQMYNRRRNQYFTTLGI